MTIRIPPYDALILDMDGVIVEPTPSDVFDEAVAGTVEALDIDPIAPGDHETLRSLSAATPEALADLGRTYGVGTDTLWRTRERIVAEHQLRFLERSGKPTYPDVDALFSLDLPAGLVSNNQDETVDGIVRHRGFDSWLDAWSGIEPTLDGLDRAKPAPWYLEAMIDELGAENPIFVGDRPSDVHAAKRAGIDSALLKRVGDVPTRTECEPTHELTSLTKLTEIMNHDIETRGADRTDAESRQLRGESTRPDPNPDDGLSMIARFDRPVAEERTRIAVVADPHIAAGEEGTPKLFHRGVERLRRAFDDAESRNVDAVVSVGDLTKDGAPEEYDRFDECLKGLGVAFFAVPGNHDVPKASTEDYEYGDSHETPSIDRFIEQYTPGSLPFHVQLGGVNVLGINTASTPDGELRQSHDGKLSDEQLSWLDATLGGLDNAVVLMHHNTPRMYEQLRAYSESVHPEMGMPPTMRDPAPLVDTLERHEVPLVLTGHLHIPGVAETGAVRELTVPATCSYPQGYVLLDIDSNGTTARYVSVTDTEGMTEAHGERRIAGETSQGLTAFSAIQLASAPLVDDRKDDATEPSP